MKKYVLKKDLPFAKAGDIFKGELEHGEIILFPEDYENYEHKLSSDEFWDFDEWFEEVKELERYFTINILKAEVNEVMKIYHSKWAIENMKSLGILFETKQEAEKYLRYLEAKAIIKQDAKGFKADWTDNKQDKFHGQWDYNVNKLYAQVDWELRDDTIYFESIKAIKESFKTHPKEWKEYLTYEQ